MRNDPSLVDSLIDRGIDLRGRRIWLQSEINDESAKLVVRGLFALSDISAAPVTLMICSGGGDSDNAFEIHDAMRLVRPAIHTVAFGQCGSCAPLLLAAGAPKCRRATADCEFMYHGTSGAASGSVKNLRSYADAIEKRSKRMDRLMVEYGSMTGHHWSRMNQKTSDTFFSAKDAMDWGLIDKVL